MVEARGVAGNLFRRGKRAGSVTSGVHTGTNPRVGSGAKLSETRKIYAENLIECHKFRTVQIKQKFSPRQFRRGHVPPCPPFPTPLVETETKAA